MAETKSHVKQSHFYLFFLWVYLVSLLLSIVIMFCKPAAVYSKTVGVDATYDDVLRWWQSDDGVAQAGRAAVQQGAVCFVQLGGSRQVFVSLPPGRSAVRPCRKARGTPGVAVLMTYV